MYEKNVKYLVLSNQFLLFFCSKTKGIQIASFISLKKNAMKFIWKFQMILRQVQFVQGLVLPHRIILKLFQNWVLFSGYEVF